MENINFLTLILPVIFSLAIIGGLIAWLKKKPLLQSTRMRICPHCYGTIPTAQTVCENCRRKVVFTA